jgi:signal transduction histidine kinase
MRIKISPEPPRRSAHSRTDDGFRRERRLIDQISRDALAAAPQAAIRLRQARQRSDSRLAGERVESSRSLLREQSARDAAAAALADREESLALFGHEMKSLLSLLSMHAELRASQSEGDSEGQENVRRIAGQMDRLISNLLDFGQLRAGKFQVVFGKRNASEIVKEAVKVFRPIASARALSLEARLPGKELPVRVDPDRIFQVLSNLFSNAIRITPRGGQISVTAARQERQVQFAVRDTGRGIAETDLERIFNPYCQLGRGEPRGLGLGLFISRSIIQAHGGRIWAESRLGSGTTFYFTVPGAKRTRPGKTGHGEASAS